jgi:hypothetical protein
MIIKILELLITFFGEMAKIIPFEDLKLNKLYAHFPKSIPFVLFIAIILSSGCLRYSFTGVSIPSDVSTIYIPFFADNSNSGLSNLSDQLNETLINRFVNQTRLQLVDSEGQADILLMGTITGYSNQPFSVSGDQTASLNRVQITVNGTFIYTRDEDPIWNRSFTGQAEYDPSENPLDGEISAATDAMDRIAQNMFNDSVGRW